MLIDRLVDHALTTRFEDFAPDVIEAARLRLIDSLSCTVGGVHAGGNSAMLQLIRTWGGAEGDSCAGVVATADGLAIAGTVRGVVDVAGRPYAVCHGEPEAQVYALIGGSGVPYAGSMTYHVVESLALNAGLCVHLDLVRGRDPHHIVEAQFKALARALRTAVEPDPRIADQIPSTKGAL